MTTTPTTSKKLLAIHVLDSNKCLVGIYPANVELEFGNSYNSDIKFDGLWYDCVVFNPRESDTSISITIQHKDYLTEKYNVVDKPYEFNIGDEIKVGDYFATLVAYDDIFLLTNCAFNMRGHQSVTIRKKEIERLQKELKEYEKKLAKFTQLCTELREGKITEQGKKELARILYNKIYHWRGRAQLNNDEENLYNLVTTVLKSIDD